LISQAIKLYCIKLKNKGEQLNSPLKSCYYAVANNQTISVP